MMILTYKFVESGGYDCMTDAHTIENDEGKTIATLDHREFGASPGYPLEGKAFLDVEELAQDIVDRYNYIQREGYPS